MSVAARLSGSEGAPPDDRVRDRHRRIALATVAGVASRGLTALSLVIALPLAADHLDRPALGIWTLLVSAVALLGFADLGIGNGLVNVLSAAVGRDDPAGARSAVTAAAAGLVAVVAGGVVLLVGALALAPWESVLGVGRDQVTDLHPALAVAAGAVLCSIPASLGQRVHLAYQQGWAAAATNGVGSLLSLGGVIVVARLDLGLAWFVAAMLGGPVIAAAGETAWVLGRSHTDLRPTPAAFDRGTFLSLLRSGWLFFVLALAGAAAYHSDTVVIANHLGPADVTRYAVALRVFLLAPTALSAMLLPLWPAYAEAIARGDHDWVARTLRRTILLSVGVSGAASLVLIVTIRPLLDAWASGSALPSTGLVVALGCWAVVSAVSNALAMYLNGASVIRLQVIVAVAMAVTNLTLSLVLVRHIGVAGPVWASVITQVLTVLVPEVLVLRPMLRRGPRPGVRLAAAA